jgi:hypothetical protein
MSPERHRLLQRVAALPEELLGDVAESVDDILSFKDGVYRLSDEERAAVRKGMKQAQRGEFVSEEEMAAFYLQLRG